MRLNNKGFTLVELLAAVVIITLLTVIAVPSVLHSLNTGKDKSYEILVKNIVIASQELYEEVYSNELLHVNSASIFYYDKDKESESVTKSEELIKIDSSTIIVNLQTLVSNGFLSGTNKEISSDETIKIITNPKADNKDIGSCEIKIVRNNTTSNKVTYTVINLSETDSFCPTTDDYKKGVS